MKSDRSVEYDWIFFAGVCVIFAAYAFVVAVVDSRWTAAGIPLVVGGVLAFRSARFRNDSRDPESHEGDRAAARPTRQTAKVLRYLGLTREREAGGRLARPRVYVVLAAGAALAAVFSALVGAVAAAIVLVLCVVGWLSMARLSARRRDRDRGVAP